jgi:hypothetical protein
MNELWIEAAIALEEKGEDAAIEVLKGNTQLDLSWVQSRCELLAEIAQNIAPAVEVEQEDIALWFMVNDEPCYDEIESTNVDEAKQLLLKKHPAATLIKSKDEL